MIEGDEDRLWTDKRVVGLVGSGIDEVHCVVYSRGKKI